MRYIVFRLLCAASFTAGSVFLFEIISRIGAIARLSFFSASRLISITWINGSVCFGREVTSESLTMRLSANEASEYNAASRTFTFLSWFSVLTSTWMTC